MSGGAGRAAAIILAAGESRRMGRPKALLPYRGGTFLSVLAETLGDVCSPVIAVFGYQAETMSGAAPKSVVPVTNPDYEQGMLTSLQAGLRALGELPERILFTLVDHPAVSASTVSAILDVDAPVVIPRYAGKRGHPVAISAAAASEFLSEPSASRMNLVVNRLSVQYVDVDDPGVTNDVDDPDAYARLIHGEAA